MFALLVPSLLYQVRNKLLTTYNELDGIINLVTKLCQQVCYSHDMTRMLQGCQHKAITILLYQACNGLVRTRGAGSNLGHGGQLLKKGQFVLLTNKQKKLKFRKPPVFIKSVIEILTRIWNSTCCAIVISAILYLITFIRTK